MRLLCRKDSTLVMDPSEMNLSLNGCGYLGIYHVGVCSCIKKYYPQALKGKISGGSVGALVACAFMCDVPLDICAKYVFDVSMKVRNGILGPMSPDLDIMRVLYESMDAMLPDDAHLHCDGRLNVSVTRFDTGTNVLLNKFKSREELLQALMCSCFIPVYCGYEPPEFYGVAYVDAALSDNSPWLNKYTVIVAPFSGNSDICPENDGYLLKSLTLSNTSIGLTAKNMYMLFRVLFPASPDVQKDICQRGYNDALRFLRNRGLIPCPNCKVNLKRPDHKDCPSPHDNMPVEITNEIDKAIVQFNKHLSYRLFKFRSMKLLYYMNMPSIFTAKVAYLIMCAVLQKVHNKVATVDEIWSHFLRILKDGLYRPNSHFISGSLKDELMAHETVSPSEQSKRSSVASSVVSMDESSFNSESDDSGLEADPVNDNSFEDFNVDFLTTGHSCLQFSSGQKTLVEMDDSLKSYVY